MTDSIELEEAGRCLRKNPRRALAICDKYLASHPNDDTALFRRFQAFDMLGEFQKALADINRVIDIKPDFAGYSCRGMLLRKLGDHAAAVADFTRSREADGKTWRESFDPHFRADSLARLGRLDEALADCAHIRDDHWMPGVLGLPRGNKAEFIAEIKRRALAARQQRS
jgi:tetratricopeptide (TPR) repeat protein